MKANATRETLVVEEDGLDPYREDLAALEATRTYPLEGTTRFRIDHGEDYARFFRGLGRPRFVLVRGSSRGLLGVAVAVERTIRPRVAGRATIWYLCDLKTDPGAAPATTLLALLRGLARATREFAGGAYFVAMEDPRRGGSDLGLSGLLARRAGFRPACRQRIVLAPTNHRAFEDRDDVLPRSSEAGGPLGIRSLAGVKDLVLVPGHERLSLAHVDVGRAGGTVLAEAVARSARRAARRGFGSVAWAFSAEDGDAWAAFSRRGIDRAGLATTWHLDPAGGPWPDLAIETAEI